MSTNLVGRDIELGRIAEAVASAEQSGSTLLLHGDPGIGKSSLLEAARASAGRSSFTILHTAGTEAEMNLPYAGLERLLRPLLTFVPMLNAPRQRALTTALGLGEGPSSHPLLVAFAVIDLVRIHAAGRPTLISLDDTHWLDSASRMAVGLAGRNLAGHHISILAATRPGYPEVAEELGFPELEVAGVDDLAAIEILAAHGIDTTAAARERLVRDAAGNPLALIELSGTGVAGAPANDSEYAVPMTERLERAFGARFRRMPGPTRKLLLIAAADETCTIDEIVAAGAHVPGAGGPRDLMVAESAGLIATTQGRVTYRHPLVRSAIYREAALEDKLAAHAALALVTEADLDRRARHRAASAIRNDDQVAAEVEAAAERARARGGFLEAAQGLRRASSLTEDTRHRVRRLLEAAQLAFEVGRADLVQEAVEEVRMLDLSVRERARADLLAEAFYDGIAGDVGRVASLVEDARSVAALGDVELALELLRGAAVRCWWAALGRPIREQVLTAAEELPITASDPRLMAIIACVAPLERGAQIVSRVPDALAEAGDDQVGLWCVAIAAHAVNDHALSMEILSELIPALREHGRFGLLTQALSMIQWDAAMLGDWPTTESTATEGDRYARDTGQRVWGAGITCGLSAVAAIRREALQAEKLADQAEAVIVPHRLSDMHSVLLTTRGIAAVADERYDDAFEILVRAFDPDDPGYHYREKFGALSFLARAASGSHRLDEGRRIIDAASESVGEAASLALRSAIADARRILDANGHRLPLGTTPAGNA